MHDRGEQKLKGLRLFLPRMDMVGVRMLYKDLWEVTRWMGLKELKVEAYGMTVTSMAEIVGDPIHFDPIHFAM